MEAGPVAQQQLTSWRDALLASSLDAIIVMDTDGVIREFNHAAQKTFGFSQAEAVGNTVAQTIVPPELRERHWHGLDRYLRTGEGRLLNQRIEIEGVRKDGSRLPVELTIVPFEAEGHRLFVGYLRDLTEAKKAEEEVARASNVAVLLRDIPLKASRADSFHAAATVAIEQVCKFAGWPVGHVYVRDPERDVLQPKKIWYFEDEARFAAFRDITNKTELAYGEGLPGRAWKEDRPIWMENIQDESQFVRASQVKELGVRSGLAVPIPVGARTEAVLEFYTESLTEPDEQLMSITEALVHELGRVLERQRHREDLRKANEQLEEMAGRRADFLNLAAHELKNPLTPLSLQLQMLRRTGPLNERQEASLAVADRSVRRLREIVDDLLEGARAQSGTLTIEPEETDLARLAADVVRAYDDAAAAKDLRIELDLPKNTTVRVDPKRAAQVLDNLVSNAIKFTPSAGKVTIRGGIEDRHAFLEVADTGAGIEPSEQHRLFQPFSQVHSKQVNPGGTGLGLYVCQAIMEAHGGRMGVESGGEGQGSVFWARWPLDPPDADGSSASQGRATQRHSLEP